MLQKKWWIPGGVAAGCVAAAAVALVAFSGASRAQSDSKKETESKRAERSDSESKPAKKPKPAATESAQAKPAAPAAEEPKPAVDPNAASPFVAVEQAKKVGAGCLAALSDVSKISIDSGHTAVSIWNKDTPGQRAFSALNFLKYQNPVAPRAVALVTVSPTAGNHCDASSFRIQPSRLSCEEIAGNLAKQNAPKPQAVEDIAMYPPNNAGQRVILIPAASSGCVVVSTGSYYGP